MKLVYKELEFQGFFKKFSVRISNDKAYDGISSYTCINR